MAEAIKARRSIQKFLESDGKLGKDKLPDWLVEDAIARRYGCSPADVRDMPYEDVQRALILISAENAAEKTKAKRANRP